MSRDPRIPPRRSEGHIAVDLGDIGKNLRVFLDGLDVTDDVSEAEARYDPVTGESLDGPVVFKYPARIVYGKVTIAASPLERP